MEKSIEIIDRATVRFAGDSGDGMQLVGKLFAMTAGESGNDVDSFPDYPSEIRAPEGTLYGVSAYQSQIAAIHIHSFGDAVDTLVAMNASSLKTSLPKTKKGAFLIVNVHGFGKKNLDLAQYDSNPLEDGSLKDYKVAAIDIVAEVKELLKDSHLTPKEIERTKNFFALGTTYWLYDKPLEITEKWLKIKFKRKPNIMDANIKALRAGYEYAKNSDKFPVQYKIEKAKMPTGFYRNITGNEAVAMGLAVAALKANLPLFLGSYPITPATEILHFISGYKKYGVKHLQAEDEIAGVTSAIGAAYGGYLAATTTSGPGLSLKTEALGLAVILELPLIVVDVQRGGPSTGLPTKPEQADLLFAMYGRHGEAPLPIIAARTASDCFHQTLEAARIAVKYMTPVILLTDGYLAQGTSPFKIPTVEELPEIPVKFADNPETYQPYKRDPETLARLWAVPGMKGFEHRIGGLEKEDVTGNVSQDPLNHQKMVELRAKKIENIANDIPPATVRGEPEGDILILGWGGTYGAISDAVSELRKEGVKASHCHLTHLNPFPKNLGEILNKFDRILIPELNTGHLQKLIREKFLRTTSGLHKVQGLPLTSIEVKNKVHELLKEA